MLKPLIRKFLEDQGYELRRVHPPGIADLPDRHLYRPLFSPWLGGGEFADYYKLAAPRSLVSADRCFVLYSLLKQALHIPGDIWECGVYRGGTAAMIARLLKNLCPSKQLYLFDTFEGMPQTDSEKDWHKQGDFSDTSLEGVMNYIDSKEQCVVRKGFIPDTFKGLESAQVALAHIDVDIYRSIIDCLEFIWPRLSPGGFIVFDDYGAPTCPGARSAVDDFFRDRDSVPLCIPTGQALVFKGCPPPTSPARST